MIKNYFKTAWRNFKKNKIFSFINIVGLATGLACFIFIALYVYHELNYDTSPAEAGNIYRVNLESSGNANEAIYPMVDNAVGEGMQATFPEIKSFSRLVPANNFVKYENNQFKEDKLAYADANFLQLFSIPLQKGKDQLALATPNSIVVSKDFAKKYFGDADPLGKSLQVGLQNDLYKVTGVFDKVPENSHFHFDAFISFSSLHIIKPTWSNVGTYTYLLLKDKTDPKKLQAKFPQLVQRYVVPEVQQDMGISLAEAQKTVSTFQFTLQPLKEIHLYSHTKYEMEPGGDIQYVYIFSLVAIFILLLACINFTNLSIARSIKRAKEVGVRKVMGSSRPQLIRQFLSESVMMSLAAMLAAFSLVLLLLPYFNQVAGTNFHFSDLFHTTFILALTGLVIIVGILAGIYPSYFLSSFNPAKVLKGKATASRSNHTLRSSLLVFQFLVSTALIISTIIIYQQLDHMQQKKLGFEKEQVLFLPDARLLGKNQDAFKQNLLQDSRVVAASISRSFPGGNSMMGTEVIPQNDQGSSATIHLNIFQVDEDYIKTLGMQMKQGRFFSKAYGTDSNAVVINEAAVRDLGWSHTDPIGKTIQRSGQQIYTVIGVVHDFNYASARQSIAPLMMVNSNNYGGLLIKIKTADIAGFLATLKNKWQAFTPQGALSYYFIDENFAALYAGEIRTQQIFSIFAFLAIIIAALGLFGLSAFVIEQRTKEIGIRKTLGASIRQIIFLVSKEFLWLVAIAFILAVPLTYWAMHQWLAGYAYRIQIGAGIFIIAGIITLLITVLTICFQTIKAARANPVNALRTE